jgi:hypothetical protein
MIIRRLKPVSRRARLLELGVARTAAQAPGDSREALGPASLPSGVDFSIGS